MTQARERLRHLETLASDEFEAEEVRKALEWAVEFCEPDGMRNEIWLGRARAFKSILAAIEDRAPAEQEEERTEP